MGQNDGRRRKHFCSVNGFESAQKTLPLALSPFLTYIVMTLKHFNCTKPG